MVSATPLPRVRTALRSEQAKLRGIDDIAYRVDVEAQGAECLVVHLATQTEETFGAAEKRQIERQIRTALAKILDWSVYFRWRTTAEAAEERKIVTNTGIVDQLHSVR